MPRRCCEFVDSRLRRSPPDRASAVPYGQAGENALRFPRLAHRSAAVHKLHSATATTSYEFDFREKRNHQPATNLSLFSPEAVQTTGTVANINRTRLENLIHRIFGHARLDIEIKDRFGQPIVPREWFLVPLFAVDEAIERIREGTITGCIYDPKTARLAQAVGT